MVVDPQGEGSADAHLLWGSSMRLTRAAMQPTNFSREFPRICYYKQRNNSYEYHSKHWLHVRRR